MTDRPDEPSETQPLTPEQEARVRSLLAEARHVEPMPPAVVARLESRLAELATDRAPETPREAPVVELAARRRRRRVSQALVAAAAVAAVGLAGPSLLRGVTMGGADSASRDAAGGMDAPEAQAESHRNSGDIDVPELGKGGFAAARKAPVRLRAETFERDVARAFGHARAPVTAADTPAPMDGGAAATSTDGAYQACSRGALPAGWRTPARYAGLRGWLVFSEPEDGRSLAQFFPCGSTTPLRTVELDVR